MIVIAGLVIGAAIGARPALKRGGRKLDALQYGAAYGILFALAGLVVIVAVFCFKVLHAQAVCSDMSGNWVHGDCVFDEQPVR